VLILPFGAVVSRLHLFLHNRAFWLPKALPNREEGEPNRTFTLNDPEKQQVPPLRFPFPDGNAKLRSE
jgi:hypothetical protein